MKRFGWFIAVGVLLVILLVAGLGLAGAYNGLVQKSQAVDGQWAQVEAQYQRRYDLIPNLVASVKGYLKQEQTIFDAITQARTKYAGAATASEKAEAAGEVEVALGRLLAIVESNPEIKSDKVVVQLMDELAGTENRISVERGRYNTAVRTYNTSMKSFPGNIMAGLFGFEARGYFESSAGADKPPVVDFG